MRKALWFSISAAIAGALLFAVSGCGPGADTGYTGTVSYSWVTPDLLPTYAGYYEGNQTITMENGIATKAVAEMVVFLGEPWAGISLITVMHSSKSWSPRGIFRDVTSAKMYVSSEVIGYEDPVPEVPIEPAYLWAESSVVWSGDDLTELTAMSGATVLGKYSLDYESGRRNAMRYYNTSNEYWDKAEYYPTWDATFDIPTEIWHFANEGDIPAGYDYATNPLELPRYYNESAGLVDHQYSIGTDGQGRIATLVEFVDTGLVVPAAYDPYSLCVYTYDGDSEIISGIMRYEGYHGDVEPGVYTNPLNYLGAALSITFNIPEEAGFEMSEMMLEPLQRLFLPFIYQNEFIPR